MSVPTGGYPTFTDASTMRNGFTTIFVVLNFAISWLGSRLLKRRAQHHLTLQKKGKQNKAVPINHLTPWLGSICDFASYIWHIRSIPGGRYGILMLWTAVFSLAHQYFINSFVMSFPMASTCKYDIGINSIWINSFSSNVSLTGVAQWYPASVVYDAFRHADLNGGKAGIYEKIPNTNLTTFRPTDDDIVGYWNCTQEPGTIMNFSDWSSRAALMNYSSEKGFLYTQASSIKGAVAVTGGALQGFMYWSANELANSSPTYQWDVRATIMDELQYISPNQTATTNNFQCSIVSTAKNWSPPKMPAQNSLDEWAEHMYGAIRNQSSWTYKPQLERVLNTMSILSGSGNSAWLHILPGQSSTYGCLVNGSVLSIEVVILFYALILVLLMVISIDLYAFISYKIGRVGEKGKELSYVPTDLISWQLAMVKKSTGNEGLTTGDLKEIGFSYVRKGDGVQELEFREVVGASANAPLLPMAEYKSVKKESLTMTVTEKFGPSTP